MPIGFLGILKAGGVYVPIDPAYPKDRTDYMLADAGAALQLEGVDDPEILRESPERVGALSEPDHLAYIIYTSGSTGRPKGVMVTHGSVVEYADTLGRELGIEPSDVYLHTASISFSSSIRQFVVPLTAGATVAIAGADERRDPAALLRRIRDSRVTIADVVPTMVRQVVDAVVALAPGERAELVDNRLRLLLTASEPLRFGLVRDWRAHLGRSARWINMYGQTETTGIVSLYPVPETGGDDPRIVPIGRPRGNVAMLVLDRQLRPVPCGVAGDLYIGGEALAQGYTGDPALTAERFFPSPWGDGERLYAAGDVVRLGWDGTIEFLGRADQQVKIRGLRIEPAEIERVLLEHSGVREAVISVLDDGSEGQRLVAYFTPTGPPIPLSALRAHARQKLPEHMVPSAFVALERLPLTPNGKFDRGALPKPERVRADEAEYVPPRAGVEESLASIWRQVLRVDRVGASDNFFSLGGHSLLAAQVRSRIQSALEVDLPLGAIFEDQTLSALALRIEACSILGRKQALPPLLRAARAETMPASYAQELMWQLEQTEPGARAHWIDVALRLRGPLDASRLVRSVSAAVERHEVLRTVFRPSRGSLSQVILGSFVPDVRIIDAPESTPSEADGADGERIDLAAWPGVRVELLRTREDEHILRLLVHRILGDGFSMRLLLGEIGALYASSLGEMHLPLLDPAIQYADYAAWERGWLTAETLAEQIEFFRGELEGADAAFTLPTDHPRPALRLRRGSRLHFELPPEISDAAHAMAARERASLYMVLLAAFASAIGRYARRPAVVIGSPVSRRNQPGTERILGPFMNTLPLRIDLPDGSSLPNLVRNVKAVLLAALAHQDAPFHHVTAALTAEHGPAAAGIGQVAFVIEDPAPSELVLGGLSLTRVEPVQVTSRRELTLSVAATNGEIAGMMTYDRDLFNVVTIQRIVRDFEAALAPARDDDA